MEGLWLHYSKHVKTRLQNTSYYAEIPSKYALDANTAACFSAEFRWHFFSSSDIRSKPPRNYLRLFIIRFKTHPRLLTTGQGFDIGARCDESYPHPIAILMT